MVDRIQAVSNSTGVDLFSKMTALLTEHIDSFYVVFIYELKDLHATQLQQQVEHISEFYDIIFKTDFKAYIVTEKMYNENPELYAAILQQAREKTVFNFTRASICYCLERDMDHTQLLQGNDFTALFQLIEQTIFKKLKLNTNDTWQSIHRWYVTFIKQKVVEELILQMGMNQLKALSKEALNELFFQTCNYEFINGQAFVEQLKEEMLRSYSTYSVDMLQQMKALVSNFVNEQQSVHIPATQQHDPAYKGVFIPNFIFVPNLIIYQIIREAIYQRAFSVKDGQYPVYRFYKGKTVGTIEVIPPGEQSVERASAIVNSFSALDVDVLDILFALYIYQAKQPGDVVEVSVSDILKMRGLREKISGQGRRGGFEKKQRTQIVQALQAIQSLSINVEQMAAYNKEAFIQKPGRIFLFQTQHGEQYEVNEHMCMQTITFKVDHLFEGYLSGAKRQLALLPSVSLQYHTSRMAAEKQLTRYLSWRWRTLAFKGDYLQPNKVHTLLQAMGGKLQAQAPMRTRERLEKTLDTLAEDGIIAGWHYFKWDEDVSVVKGWAKYWLNASIIIEPSDSIKKHYAKIEQTKRQTTKTVKQYDTELAGEVVMARRRELKLTLLQLAEILNVTAPYISNIEKGKVKPSAKLRDKIAKWLHETEPNTTT